MRPIGATVFETALGFCAIAWGERGIVRVVLPEPSAAKARAALVRKFPGAQEAEPPVPVRAAIEGIVALLRGEAADLSGVALDLAGVTEFQRRVYAIARTVPAGATMTYGDVAARLGDAGAARDVGQAMGDNPFPIIVPCHRVVAAGGKLGGFSAPGGAATKRRLLAVEAAHERGTLFSKS